MSSNAAALATALEYLTPRQTRYNPHEPEPRQAVFLLLSQLEALYGGAAGGGKSDALLMGALQYADVPGFAALLLRRTFKELSQPGALMERADQWLRPSDAAWNGQEHQWVFPSGAKIQFGHMQYETDRYQYQSAEYQYVGVDEATEFQENMYTFLISRCRRPSAGPLSQVPLRVRAASNPGGIGHQWVKSRFIPEPDNNGVVLKKFDLETGEWRPFVPARIQDNPHLDRESYVKSLMHLDPITRERLLNGDWDVQVGGMFSRLWFEIIGIAPITIGHRARYYDLASTEETPGQDPDYTSTHKGGFDMRTKDFIIEEGYRARLSPASVEALIKQNAQADGRSVTIYVEQEPGASGKLWIDYLVRELPGWVVVPMPSRGNKQERAAPLASYAEQGHVKLVQGLWIPDFLAEVESFGFDDLGKPLHPHDDQVDSASGLFHVLTMGAGARSRSGIPQSKEPVRVKGDLRLVGERYVDKPPVGGVR